MDEKYTQNIQDTLEDIPKNSDTGIATEMENASYDSLKRLTDSMGLIACRSDLLFIREHYKKAGYLPTRGVLRFLDEILRQRKSSQEGYAFSKCKITDKEIAEAYIYIIAAVNKAEPHRRQAPPTTEELIHLPCGKSTPAAGILDLSPIVPSDSFVIKDTDQNTIFAIGKGRKNAPQLPYASGNAFIMLTPKESGTDYKKSIKELISDEAINTVPHSIIEVDSFGIAVTLARVCDGVFIDPSKLRCYCDPFVPVMLKNECVGSFVLVTPKENVPLVEETAAKHRLSAAYFAKATSTGNLTVNSELSDSFSLPCAFIRELSLAEEYGESFIADEKAPKEIRGASLVFEHSERELVDSISNGVIEYDGKLISPTLIYPDGDFFHSGKNAVKSSVNTLISAGITKDRITVSLVYGYNSSDISQNAKGETLAMILGAYDARRVMKLSEIDSHMLSAKSSPFVACIAFADKEI